ncbi:MAG: SCO family protein [Myxococcales bacterium]
MPHRRSTAVLASVAALAIAGTLAPARASAVQWGPDYFPNVTLTTQDGKTVRFYDDLLKGKIVAIDLIYTHCKYSCPLETARLAQVQRLLGDRVGKDIFFYSITLDPERDTPEVLKAYAQKFHAGPGWLFLTGKKEDIKLIGHKMGLLSASADPAPINRDGHTPELMIGNVATGTWMRNSAVDNAQLLATTMRRSFAAPDHAGPAKTYAQARELSVSKGQYLFTTRCAACHTIGHGDGLGPDLLGVTHARDRAWLTRFIQFPDRVMASGDPVAKALSARYNGLQMPNVGLGPEDVAALIDHIEARSAAQSGSSLAASH